MKYAGDSGDPYLDKATGVLRNLLGISHCRDELLEGSTDLIETVHFDP
jgi:hypothetical protein